MIIGAARSRVSPLQFAKLRRSSIESNTAGVPMLALRNKCFNEGFGMIACEKMNFTTLIGELEVSNEKAIHYTLYIHAGIHTCGVRESRRL